MATYTYVIMEVSQQTFKEIERKMRHAGYPDAFHQTEHGVVIDMHGIAVAAAKEETSHLIVNKQIEWIKKEIPKPNDRILIKFPDGRVSSATVAENGSGVELDHADAFDLFKLFLKGDIEWHPL